MLWFRHVDKSVKGKTITTADPAVFVICAVGSVSKAKTESLSLYQAVKISPLVLFSTYVTDQYMCPCAVW